MRDYMDRRVTPPKRVNSPTRGPSPPCKQTLRGRLISEGSLGVFFCCLQVDGPVTGDLIITGSLRYLKNSVRHIWSL